MVNLRSIDMANLEIMKSFGTYPNRNFVVPGSTEEADVSSFIRTFALAKEMH